MKTMIPYLLSASVIVVTLSMVCAQTQVIKVEDAKPELIGDLTIRQRLEKDWKKRNPQLLNETVVWYELKDGFYGTYVNHDQNYMTLYDQNGAYIVTLKKTKWSDKVPATVKSSFDLSNYNMQEVVSYWEASGLGKKCYYMELKDKDGKVSRVWLNEKGDFSTTLPSWKL